MADGLGRQLQRSATGQGAGDDGLGEAVPGRFAIGDQVVDAGGWHRRLAVAQLAKDLRGDNVGQQCRRGRRAELVGDDIKLPRSAARRSTVLTKLLPWAPNTQLVRKTKCSAPLAASARSPSRLVAP